MIFLLTMKIFTYRNKIILRISQMEIAIPQIRVFRFLPSIFLLNIISLLSRLHRNNFLSKYNIRPSQINHLFLNLSLRFSLKLSSSWLIKLFIIVTCHKNIILFCKFVIVRSHFDLLSVSFGL